MFDRTVEAYKRTIDWRRVWELAFSLVLHGVVASVLVAGSFLLVERVQDPDIVITFLGSVVPPIPPPPPPPPPRGGGRKQESAIERREPKGLAQPTSVPDKIPETLPGASEEEEGEEGGVEGGVPGGVPGGVVGGVVGGVLGGILGGTTGGVLGHSDEPLIVSGDIKPPQLIRKVSPEYPGTARRARIGGTVILQAIISETGDVESVTVLRSKALLDEAAVTAVRQWKYKPATLNGRPVRVYFTVTVAFTLTGA